MKSSEYPDLEFVRPKSFTRGRPAGPPRLIVIHYTAGSEGRDSAENGAAYDARRDDGVSTHYFVDADSVVQCVLTTDQAHAAKYRGNLYGIQYELCGTAQTREQWLDATSRATIRHAAKQIVRDMQRYNIPGTRVVGAGVRTGTGICGHVDCTVGFPEDRGTHTDPGTAFPWDVLFSDIADLSEDDDMSVLDEPLNPTAAPGVTVRAALTELFLSRGGRGQINANLLETRELRAIVDQLALGQGVDVDALVARVRAAFEEELKEDHLRAAGVPDGGTGVPGGTS